MKGIRSIVLSGLILSVCAANAQSFSSFSQVGPINDVSFNPTVGLSYALITGPNPTFIYNSVTYHITEVFGVWLRDPGSVSATGTNQNGWTFDASNSSGSIAGWKTTPNNGQPPSQSQTFTYSTLSPVPTQVGYHVRISETWPIGSGGGNTGYIVGSPVPEPASMIAFGVGALGIVGASMRRRRKA